MWYLWIGHLHNCKDCISTVFIQSLTRCDVGVILARSVMDEWGESGVVGGIEKAIQPRHIREAYRRLKLTSSHKVPKLLSSATAPVATPGSSNTAVQTSSAPPSTWLLETASNPRSVRTRMFRH